MCDDYNTEFIYDEIKTKKCKIKKIDDLNFAKVFGGDEI